MADPASAPLQFERRPPRCGVAHAWLLTEEIEVLEREADLRDIHLDQLVAELMRAIIYYRPHLFRALLDRKI